MKRMLLLLALAAVLTSGGCQWTTPYLARNTCGPDGQFSWRALLHGPKCRCHHCLLARMHNPPNTGGFEGPHGPPSAAVTYPYYTTRGPRDFLLDQPPPLGR